MTPIELYNAFIAVTEKGDEQAAKNFLIEHFNEFPEAVREKIAFAFFEDAANLEGDSIAATVQVQEEGKKILEEMLVAQQNLEDAQKATEIKESI